MTDAVDLDVVADELAETPDAPLEQRLGALKSVDESLRAALEENR